MSNSHSSTPQIKQLSTQDLRKVKHIIKLINRRNKEKNHCEKEKKPTCWRRLERSWKSCASDFPSSAIFWISSISLSLSLCFLQYNLFFFFWETSNLVPDVYNNYQLGPKAIGLCSVIISTLKRSKQFGIVAAGEVHLRPQILLFG